MHHSEEDNLNSNYFARPHSKVTFTTKYVVNLTFNSSKDPMLAFRTYRNGTRGRRYPGEPLGPAAGLWTPEAHRDLPRPQGHTRHTRGSLCWLHARF